ncbi:MAG: ferritin family protein [Phycisphaerales bacterium]|nr:MAG: ferritin family protein [Phycisphaerales bacterium]
MNVELNVFEVLDIAEQIERNGAKFYRRAAELFADGSIEKLFLDLATWENAHVRVFANMRAELSEQNWESGGFEPTRLDLPDAQVMAGLAVFGVRPNPAEELTGNEEVANIIRMAIQKEKDSIVYYTGLKDFVLSKAGKAKIDEIIAEEMRHVRILGESLEQRQ